MQIPEKLHLQDVYVSPGSEFQEKSPIPKHFQKQSTAIVFNTAVTWDCPSRKIKLGHVILIGSLKSSNVFFWTLKGHIHVESCIHAQSCMKDLRWPSHLQLTFTPCNSNKYTRLVKYLWDEDVPQPTHMESMAEHGRITSSRH